MGHPRLGFDVNMILIRKQSLFEELVLGKTSTRNIMIEHVDLNIFSHTGAVSLRHLLETKPDTHQILILQNSLP